MILTAKLECVHISKRAEKRREVKGKGERGKYT